MTPNELEDRLGQLGTEWPAPSAVDNVMARLGTEPVTPASRWGGARRRLALVGLGALAATVTLVWALGLEGPSTLQAQMQREIAAAQSAHVIISGLDERGVRQREEIWYARGRGFRMESPDEVIIDNGRQQWAWHPGPPGKEVIVTLRSSRDAIGYVTGMFSFSEASPNETRQRAPEHDRQIGGQSCRAFVVSPSAPKAAGQDQPGPAPGQGPSRCIILVDNGNRVVWVEEQRPLDGRWLAGPEITIEYDVDVDEKLAVRLPAGNRVMDLDRVLADRFPLEQALGQAEAGGLLFAIHELRRGEDGIFYVVSSVRGTPKYLAAHPPQRRRLNLQTEVLEVAEQMGTSIQECHRLRLATAMSEGVHYQWGIVAPRFYFSVEQGKRVHVSESPDFEVRPGSVRVPVMAIYLPQSSNNWIQTNVDVSLPADQKAEPVADMVARAHRDVTLLQQTSGLISLYGWKNGEGRGLGPDQITAPALATEINQMLDFLRSKDNPTGSGTGPPGEEPRK